MGKKYIDPSAKTIEDAQKLIKYCTCRSSRSKSKNVKLSPNGVEVVSCFAQFKEEDIERFWKYHRKGKTEKEVEDIVMMKLSECIDQNKSFHYTILNNKVCSYAFCKLFKISNQKLQKLIDYVKENKTVQDLRQDKLSNRQIGYTRQNREEKEATVVVFLTILKEEVAEISPSSDGSLYLPS